MTAVKRLVRRFISRQAYTPKHAKPVQAAPDYDTNPMERA